MYRLLSKTIAIDRSVDYRYISAWLVIDIYLYINFADAVILVDKQISCICKGSIEFNIDV